MSRGHACPLCNLAGIPYRNVTCRQCWPLVPVPIQRRLQDTWPQRIRHPAAHREALAELLMWAREARATMRLPEEVKK